MTQIRRIRHIRAASNAKEEEGSIGGHHSQDQDYEHCERRRRKRAEACAKKLEDMFDLGNADEGNDKTAVMGISRWHRIRVEGHQPGRMTT